MAKKTPLNFAVLGVGGIGADHIVSIRQHPDARVVALAEVSPERGREAAERFGIPTLVQDYRELLARDEIDAVSIALPNYLHASVTLDALRAGKHVMIEKPMATNARDAARMITEAKRRGRVMMVGQNQRFLPEVQTLKQLIAEGELGEVYHGKTSWSRRAGIPRIGSWFTQKKFSGGGCVYDIGVHALDRGLYLMGEFDAVAVSGQTFAKFGTRGQGSFNWGKSEIDPGRPFDVEDLAVALIKLRSGRTLLLEASWAAHQPETDAHSTQLFGTEAGARFAPLQIFRSTPRGYATEAIELRPLTINPNRIGHFIEVVLGRAKSIVPSHESLAVQKILDAIYRSAKSGREVRLR
jgi:predicted dehydrogenase